MESARVEFMQVFNKNHYVLKEIEKHLKVLRKVDSKTGDRV